MKIARMALGALAAFYGLFSLMPIGFTVARKLGALQDVPDDIERLLPLFDATPWWMIGLWLLAVATLLAAAWRLFKGGKALGVYVLAFGLEVAVWWLMSRLPEYQTSFTPQELTQDYFILGALALVGVGVWWTERKPKLKPA